MLKYMPYLYLPIKKYTSLNRKTSLMCFVAIIIIAWITCLSHKLQAQAAPELINRVHKLKHWTSIDIFATIWHCEHS